MLGKDDSKSAGWVVNEFAGKTLNAKLSHPAAVIVRHNRANFHPAVAALVVSGSPWNEQSLYNSWKQVFTDIKDTNAKSIKILGKLKQWEAKSTEEEERRQKVAGFQSSVHMLGTIASFVDPELGRQISTVGTAGIRIGQAIDNFKTSEKEKPSLGNKLSLIDGIFSAVGLIASLFGGPSDEQKKLAEILHQIKELRYQVEHVREQMHLRFDIVDRRLTQMFDQMSNGFALLNTQLALARDELGMVEVRLSLMESHLLNLEPNTRSYLVAGFDRTLWQDLHECLTWRTTLHSPLPYSKFSDVLNRLRYAATIGSKDLLSTGRTLTKEELEDDSKLAACFLTLSRDGLDCNIGLMQSIAGRFGNDFGRVRLANPTRWAMMVAAYVQLASQYPEYYKQSKLESVDSLLHIGEEWQEAVRSLMMARTGEASKGSPAFYLLLLENYKAKADQLRNVVRAHIQTYQDLHDKGYDLWGGANQTGRNGEKPGAFRMLEIPAGEPFSVVIDQKWKATGNLMAVQIGKASNVVPVDERHWHGSKYLPAPSQLASPAAAKSVFDPPLLIAHHLHLGQLEVRWLVPGWEECEDRPRPNEAYGDLYGKVALTVQARFSTVSDGKVYTIFEHRVNSDELFHYGIYHWKFTTFAVEAYPSPWLGAETAKRTPREVLWLHRNRFIDPDKELLLQNQIRERGPAMLERVFQSKLTPNPAPAVQAAAQTIEARFKADRRELERELWAGVDSGRDRRLVEAMRQLTAAKAMLEAFVSLGMAKSLSDKRELRDLLTSENTAKGQTCLVDWSLLKLIPKDAKADGTLLEVTRDPEWLDGPRKKLDAYFRGMPDASEPQPLIEATMERLKWLRKMHEPQARQPSLEQAGLELRKSVQALGQR